MSQTKTPTGEEIVASKADIRKQLGELLRCARHSAGVSIEAVAHETKISKNFIVSMESGLFDQLPGRVFGRGFIKSIGRFLRFDNNELLRLYDDCWAEDGAQKNQSNIVGLSSSSGGYSQDNLGNLKAKEKSFAPRSYVRSDTKRRVRNSIASAARVTFRLQSIGDTKKIRFKLPGWLVRVFVGPEWKFGILLFIAGFMVVGVLGRWITSRLPEPPAEQQTTETASQSVTTPKVTGNFEPLDESGLRSTTEAADVAIVDSAADARIPANLVEKTLDVNNPAMAVSSASGPTKLTEESPLKIVGSPVAFDQTLEINVLAPVDLKLVIDEKRLQRTTFPVGRQAFTFHKRADLSIADAGLVEVTYNGKALGILGSKGRKRKIQFQANPTEPDFPH